jgi:regulator of sigma E protease
VTQTALSFVFAFVLLLGVLIAVHEFGHFLAAKLCGVRVLKFSLGFGPPVGFGRFRLRWERGGTEYVIAWFPLGGFVKMLGENPGEEDSPEALASVEETLGAKPVWQKLAIVFAGPFMNLVLPVFIFAGSLFVGIERPAAVAGTVERGSPAEAAGLAPGDRIVSVNGEPVRFWHEVEEAIRSLPGGRIELEVQRGEQTFPVAIGVVQRPGLDEFRLVSDVGWAGLRYARQRAVLGIPDAASPATRAGLRSGDRVVEVDGTTVEDWPGFAAAYAARGTGETLELTIERGKDDAKQTQVVPVPALGDVSALGVIPASVLVSEVTPGRPAERAGLAPGDLILAVDGEPVGSFASFAETVRASKGRTLRITYARDGQTSAVEITPELQTVDSGGLEEEAWLIGILAEDATLGGALVLDRELNPLVTFPRAVAMTWDTTTRFLRGFGKMVTGEISRKHIGGPIEIGRQAHLALQAGWDRYLELLIVISINLGILNLLPIPILDGGQALLFLVEGVKRGPLSLRTRELVQQLGFVLLVTIMGFAFWNDVTRNWWRLVEWVRESAGL